MELHLAPSNKGDIPVIAAILQSNFGQSKTRQQSLYNINNCSLVHDTTACVFSMFVIILMFEVPQTGILYTCMKTLQILGQKKHMDTIS